MERIRGTDLEVHETISEAAFLREAGRCFSCGQCHGCQYCLMYCNVGSFTRLERGWPGAYFALSLERCMGCGKCIELCPTGFLSASRERLLPGHSELIADRPGETLSEAIMNRGLPIPRFSSVTTERP